MPEVRITADARDSINLRTKGKRRCSSPIRFRRVSALPVCFVSTTTDFLRPREDSTVKWRLCGAVAAQSATDCGARILPSRLRGHATNAPSTSPPSRPGIAGRHCGARCAIGRSCCGATAVHGTGNESDADCRPVHLRRHGRFGWQSQRRRENARRECAGASFWSANISARRGSDCTRAAIDSCCHGCAGTRSGRFHGIDAIGA